MSLSLLKSLCSGGSLFAAVGAVAQAIDPQHLTIPYVIGVICVTIYHLSRAWRMLCDQGERLKALSDQASTQGLIIAELVKQRDELQTERRTTEKAHRQEVLKLMELISRGGALEEPNELNDGLTAPGSMSGAKPAQGS